MKLFNYWLHFKTICIHKYYVFKLCARLGMYWRGITHDLSKFSPTEFFEYANNYRMGKSPVDVIKEKYGYSKAWLHHKSHNSHHWSYWVDYYVDDDRVAFKAIKMPRKDMLEMICDFIGASMAYSNDKWNQAMPYDWWCKNASKMKFHTDTYIAVNMILKCIKYDGLDNVINFIRAGGYKYNEKENEVLEFASMPN